jgi:hypothetical protein
MVATVNGWLLLFTSRHLLLLLLLVVLLSPLTPLWRGLTKGRSLPSTQVLLHLLC